MQKKIPQRQCMGCRERKAKRELIRVVRGRTEPFPWISAARPRAGALTCARIRSV